MGRHIAQRAHRRFPVYWGVLAVVLAIAGVAFGLAAASRSGHHPAACALRNRVDEYCSDAVPAPAPRRHRNLVRAGTSEGCGEHRARARLRWPHGHGRRRQRRGRCRRILGSGRVDSRRFIVAADAGRRSHRESSRPSGSNESALRGDATHGCGSSGLGSNVARTRSTARATQALAIGRVRPRGQWRRHGCRRGTRRRRPDQGRTARLGSRHDAGLAVGGDRHCGAVGGTQDRDTDRGGTRVRPARAQAMPATIECSRRAMRLPSCVSPCCRPMRRRQTRPRPPRSAASSRRSPDRRLRRRCPPRDCAVPPGRLRLHPLRQTLDSQPFPRHQCRRWPST